MIENVHVIVVCLNYSDFLKITYRKNIRFFNPKNYHVIIDEINDFETLKLCKELGITYHHFVNFHLNGSKFNKSGAINMVQRELHESFPDDWILLLDADIILPDNFEILFNENCKNKDAMYSLKRYDYENEDDYYSDSKDRLVKYTGIDFMGFMQLYHRKKDLYDAFSKDGSNCDTMFRDKFYATLTYLDEHEILIHLGKCNDNCFGRVTKLWTRDS